MNILSDQSEKPNEDSLSLIIGDKILLWRKLMTYLHDKPLEISEEWKFAKDTKNWFFRTLKKKKTIFWIRVLQDGFKVAFWFGDKAALMIEESELPDTMKNNFKKAPKMGTMGRCISIDVAALQDLDNVFKLIELKLKII